jgi:hypothetical protein
LWTTNRPSLVNTPNPSCGLSIHLPAGR